MAIPPFNDLSLDPGDHNDPRRLQELFGNARRNFEDLYNRFATSEQVQESVASKPMTVGIVGKEGAIVAGGGFSVSHPETGRYTVTLSKAAGTLLVPVVEQREPGQTNIQTEVLNIGKQSFSVTSFVIAGGLFNCSFTFHVKPS